MWSGHRDGSRRISLLQKIAEDEHLDRVEKNGKPRKDQYLGKESRVRGKLNFDETVQVDGNVEGDIFAEETLIVGEAAVVTRQISGHTVVIKGQVRGDINTRTRVEILWFWQASRKHRRIESRNSRGRDL